MSWLLLLLTMQCGLDTNSSNNMYLDDGGTLNTSIVRDDNYDKSGGYTRAQLACHQVCYTGNICSASFMMEPVDWVPMTHPTTIFTAHAVPDDCDDSAPGPIDLQIIRDELWVKVYWYGEEKCTTKPFGGPIASYGRMINLKKPSQVTVEYRVNYRKNGNGFVRLSMGGQELWHYEGPVGFNDDPGWTPFGKVGVYQWNWGNVPLTVNTLQVNFSKVNFDRY